MLTPYFGANANQKVGKPKEGELYKVITLLGKTFEIYYGYYEDSDRYSKYAEPIEVYPNFIKEPIYTDEGIPFATAIQKPCQYFRKVKDINDCCGDCAYFKQGEELLGTCICDKRKKVR